MHAGLKGEQVSHYHGLGEILKAALRSGTAVQVRVETSHRKGEGTEVAGSLGALREGGGARWRAGDDVKSERIQIYGEAKVQRCDHLYLIS